MRRHSPKLSPHRNMHFVISRTKGLAMQATKNEDIKPAVIVVNDDLTQLKVLSGLLSREGFRVKYYSGAEMALDDLTPADPPDLIVTDLYMPGIDGWKFCRLLRSPEYAWCNRIPILVVSATFSGDEPSRISADLGANAFLPSPVDGHRFTEMAWMLYRGEKPSKSIDVLIVEDSRGLASMLKKSLESHGYRADLAFTGQEAGDYFSKTPYEVVILDYHLPDAKGDQLLADFRNTRPESVIIMMTSDPRPGLAVEWMKKGASAYLRKPFKMEYLIDQCNKARRERALLRVEKLLELRTGELRKSEAQMRDTLFNLKLAQAVAKMGSWHYDIAADLLTWSQETYRIFNIEKGIRLDATGYLNRVHPEDRAMVESAWQAALKGEPYDNEHRINTGYEEHWVHEKAQVVFADDGTPLEALGTIQDITDRKRIEHDILRVNEEWERTFNSVPDLIAILDNQYRIVRANKAMADKLGMPANEVVGRTCYNCVHGKDEPPDYCPHTQLLTDGRGRSVEVFEKHLGGDYLVTVSPLKDHNGQLVGSVHIARDINAKKRTEEALRIQWNLAIKLSSISDMEDALNKILEANIQISGIDCGGIYLVDESSGALELIVHRGLTEEFVAAAHLYEYDSRQATMILSGEPAYGNFSEISQSRDAAVQKEGLRAMAVIPVSYKGDIVAALNLASKTCDHFSRTTRKTIESLATHIGGVIARMKAENRERQSHELFRLLFDTIDDFLFVLDNQGQIIQFNPVVEKRLGYSAAELKGMRVTDVHPPERREEAMTIVMEMLAGKATHCPVPLCTKHGDHIPVETKVARGIWAGQEVLFGISRDITERLKVEAAWRSSEDRLRTAIDAIDEGFVIFDPDDRLAMCNAKYREIYRGSADLIQKGVKFEELVRKGIKRGQYPEAEGREEEWLAQRMALHRAADSSLLQGLKGGRWVKINERKTKDGSTVGFRVDITGLKQTEIRLQAALKEKDALLREIHHRVKNNIAVVSSLISLQAKRMEDPKIKAALKESQSRIQSMALVHEHLYQSKDMARINLQDYFQQLANSVAGVYQGARDKIVVSVDTKGITLPIDQAVPCGIILNELITNAIKYGFPNRRYGKVDIFARQTTEGVLELSVRDNGVGLSEDLDLESSKSLGLRLIGLMTDQLHGTLEVTSEGGVKTTIRWPMDGKGINQ